MSLVGKVPYFWGGKSAAGWNDEWNTPKLVTSTGSNSTGTIRPYGWIAPGLPNWVYKTALGVSLYAGTWNQWDNTYAITEDELLPGDLGFMAAPGTVPVNHVLIYAGVGDNGEQMWVHCSSGSGVVLNSPDYVTQYRRPANVDFDAAVPESTTRTPLSTLKVESLITAPVQSAAAAADGITAAARQPPEEWLPCPATTHSARRS